MARREIKGERGKLRVLDRALVLGSAIVAVLFLLALARAVVGTIALVFKVAIVVALVALFIRVFAGKRR